MGAFFSCVNIERVRKMKFLILLVLCCCFAIIQSNPVHKNWKKVVDGWRSKEVHRVRKALEEEKTYCTDDCDDSYDDGNDDEEEEEDDEIYDEDPCEFTDMCNYYNDDYDPCDLAPYDIG